MPTQYLRRGTTAAPSQQNTLDASIVYVDRDTETLKFGAASSGTTEKEAMDLSSTQTVSGVKTFTANPVITADGGIQYAEVAISSAELLALRATPKTLVAAPGAGKMISFFQAEVIADNGTAYVVGTNDAAIRYKDGTGDIISQTIDSAGLLDQTTDIVTHVQPIATDSKGPKADVENQPLVLHNTGAAEWTTGTGVVRVKIWFAVVTTGW